jgi:integrase
VASLFKRNYTSTDSKSGAKFKQKTKKWYGKYTDVHGIVRRVPLSANKAAALQMLGDLIRRAEQKKRGIDDPFEDHRKRPLLCPRCQSKGRTDTGDPCECPHGAHLTDYRRALQAKEKDPRYISQAVAHCAPLFVGTDAQKIDDIDANKVEGWLAQQRLERDMGISTSNHYLTSAKGFTRWLTKTRPPRWPSDPMSCLTKLNAETDIRRQRRDLGADEAVRLLEATLCNEDDFRGLNGEDRYFLYAVAFQSGLRAGELASLIPGSFILDADLPFLRLHAKRSKRRKNDVQPIPRELADALQPWLEKKPAGQPVWPGTWRERAWKMIGRDLAAARQTWIDEASPDAEERQRREQSDYLASEDADGRTFDFHATRHSYITLLAKSGVHPKTAQDLARHSSIDLTMNHYTHLRLCDRASALEELPSLLPRSGLDLDALRATGTDRKLSTSEVFTGPISGPKLAPTADSGRESLTVTDEKRPLVWVGTTPCREGALIGVDSDCDGVRKGWVTGLEPATFRSTV